MMALGWLIIAFILNKDIIQLTKRKMNTDKLLGMLLEAIDYSFLQMDGSYDKTLTYPVIDKIQYIKEQVKNMEVKEVDLEKEIDDYFEDNPQEYFRDDYLNFAKHFFELGIKVAQKGEEVC